MESTYYLILLRLRGRHSQLRHWLRHVQIAHRSAGEIRGQSHRPARRQGVGAGTSLCGERPGRKALDALPPEVGYRCGTGAAFWRLIRCGFGQPGCPACESHPRHGPTGPRHPRQISKHASRRWPSRSLVLQGSRPPGLYRVGCAAGCFNPVPGLCTIFPCAAVFDVVLAHGRLRWRPWSRRRGRRQPCAARWRLRCSRATGRP